jgi:hypothetical protein
MKIMPIYHAPVVDRTRFRQATNEGENHGSSSSPADRRCDAGGERGRRGRADDVGMAEHDKA